jgi:hypothetical protein
VVAHLLSKNYIFEQIRMGTWLYVEVEPWRILFLAEGSVRVLVIAES